MDALSRLIKLHISLEKKLKTNIEEVITMVKLKKYEERVIAFIDVLGFSNHISKTIDDDEHFKKIQDVFNYISELKRDNDTGTLSLKELGKEVTVFSDSIVISYPTNIPGAAFYLLLDIIHIQLDMISNGMLMRGGVTAGKLYHNDNIVYGPAMIAAHQLESKVAVYPRVLVSNKLIELGTRYPAGLNSPLDEKEYIQDLLKEDFDGQLFIDFLSQHQEVDDFESYVYTLETVKGNIEKALIDNQSKVHVLVKYEWLKNYYNTLAEKTIPENKEFIIN